MPFILHIETATKVCSVALSDAGELLVLKEIADDSFAHGEQLTLLIASAFRDAGRDMAELSAVSVTSGPGSYTGLRIGVSVAKGLCYTLSVPLIAVNALESLARLGADKHPGKTLIPMIDARRMEVYSAVYDSKGTLLKEVSADILDATIYAEFEPFVFFGDGAAKMEAAWNERNCEADNELLSSAAGQVKPAFERYEKQQFEDVAYFEPFYLKEFQGTTPKN